MIEAMTGKELPAAAPRQPSRSAEALSRADEAGAFCLANADVFECRVKIVANGQLKRDDQSRAEWVEGWNKCRRHKEAWCPMVPNWCSPMLQQEAEFTMY